MAMRRATIALPDHLLVEVDNAARALGQSRSRFVTRVLQEAVRARRDADVTKRLNELFADFDLACEQARGAAELDAVGTDWSEDVGGW